MACESVVLKGGETGAAHTPAERCALVALGLLNPTVPQYAKLQRNLTTTDALLGPQHLAWGLQGL